MREVGAIRGLVPNDQSGWMGYAAGRGLFAIVVALAGFDCTHYHTVGRTEFAAMVAEQFMATRIT